MKTLRRFLEDENGATAVEYGLIVAVLSLAVVAGVGQALNAVSALFTDNGGRFVNAFGAP
ncbi:Flp family type IVb pilin [Mesorhizobium sp. INR15]|uniref:Flp family type IVb pilin n=1 Tax=Mesorhizobium sp. INR15 TaxID=2654248 RepID=UPI0018963FE5|nr:Flp family type IVb pilin [Mesorhizobium sp. INR15]QPC90725.1 Flp family type IVb pilin [Mesorhizobium sp. INR15]